MSLACTLNKLLKITSRWHDSPDPRNFPILEMKRQKGLRGEDNGSENYFVCRACDANVTAKVLLSAKNKHSLVH
jgi:hypothetical protein